MEKHKHYWELPKLEERFNSSSQSIRGLASAWLLGTFAALAWLVQNQKNMSALAPLGLLLIIVCTVACGGFTTLWIMDQLVFHRLLNSVFLIGLLMEANDCKIPPLRSMMMKTEESRGTHFWEKFFYVGPILAFIVISLLAIFKRGSVNLFSDPSGQQDNLSYLIALLLVCLQIFILVFLLERQHKVGLFKKRAAWFQNTPFSEIVSEENYEKVIGNFMPSPLSSVETLEDRLKVLEDAQNTLELELTIDELHQVLINARLSSLKY